MYSTVSSHWFSILVLLFFFGKDLIYYNEIMLMHCKQCPACQVTFDNNSALGNNLINQQVQDFQLVLIFHINIKYGKKSSEASCRQRW